jgi:hypothetical protein
VEPVQSVSSVAGPNSDPRPVESVAILFFFDIFRVALSGRARLSILWLFLLKKKKELGDYLNIWESTYQIFHPTNNQHTPWNGADNMMYYCHFATRKKPSSYTKTPSILHRASPIFMPSNIISIHMYSSTWNFLSWQVCKVPTLYPPIFWAYTLKIPLISYRLHCSYAKIWSVD